MGGLTLNGNTRFDGLRVEDSAHAITLARSILRGAQTAIEQDGASTQLEIVNNLLVDNTFGVVTSGCAALDMRNTILSGNRQAAVSIQR